MRSIVSYNVNGIRAAARKGFADWVRKVDPDIICLQELKALREDMVKPLAELEDYHWNIHSAEKKGYSGVAIFSKKEPNHIEIGCGVERYDAEGRVIRADFDEYSVVSLYLPSGTSGDHRQGFKEEFLDFFEGYMNELKEKFPRLIICGDYNIAHRDIDIHNPISNKETSGFLPHERAWMSKILNQGWHDGMRLVDEDPDKYSWWSYRANARANNKGWRIDYHLVSDDLSSRVKGYQIHSDAVHSDHAGIELILE